MSDIQIPNNTLFFTTANYNNIIVQVDHVIYYHDFAFEIIDTFSSNVFSSENLNLKKKNNETHKTPSIVALETPRYCLELIVSLYTRYSFVCDPLENGFIIIF